MAIYIATFLLGCGIVHALDVAAGNLTICFHSNACGERGVEVALYDYADYNEKIFGYKSHIIFPRKVQHGNPSTPVSSGLSKFRQRFNVSFYDTHKPKPNDVGGPQLGRKALDLGCQVLYIIKDGNPLHTPRPDSWNGFPQVCSAVHAVFFYHWHGDVFAVISDSIEQPADQKGVYSVVPHMVAPPHPTTVPRDNLRANLGIPPSALVVCRHGGADTFDIPMAHQGVILSASRIPKEKLHFVFLNTNPFGTALSYKGQIHFLPGTSNMTDKERFYATCDAMLHARNGGESFGLAIAEMSVRNKPIITSGYVAPGMPSAHLKILGDKAFIFNTSEDLFRIVLSFVEDGVPQRDHNAFKDFMPDAVMKKFHDVFIDPCVEIIKSRAPAVFGATV
jgi:glycosyltransferase involved in cell wall biosynthesis